MITIDGSKHEGGGSILRNAIPIAAALGEEIKITNIRKQKRNPGLRTQHLLGLNLVNQLTQGTLIGGQVGSTEIIYTPSYFREKKLEIKINTAASISLIVQMLQNYVFASKNSISGVFLGGGTHTKWAPTTDYVTNVTSKVFTKFGLDLQLKVDKYGLYPRGGALASFSIDTIGTARKVTIEEKVNTGKIRLFILISEKERKKRIEENIIDYLQKNMIGTEIEARRTYLPKMNGIILTAVKTGDVPIGLSVIREKKINPNEIAEKVVYKLKEQMYWTVDEFLGDQIILPLVFSETGSKVRIRRTAHVKTNIWIVQKLLGDVFKITREEKFVTVTRK